MKIPYAQVFALLGLVLVTVLAFVASNRPPDHSPVYTVPQVQAGLERYPEAWAGRTVRVRGMVQPSGCVSRDAGGDVPCPDQSAYFLDRDGASLLTVAGWQEDPLLAALRNLPIIGRLVPGLQVVHWGALTTYHARLLKGTATACSATPCYEVLLLDAAP